MCARSVCECSRPTESYLIWIIDLKLTNFNYIQSIPRIGKGLGDDDWKENERETTCTRFSFSVDYTHKNATEQSISTHNPIINFINETKRIMNEKKKSSEVAALDPRERVSERGVYMSHTIQRSTFH